MAKETKPFSWPTIFVIGLGFFTTGISWSLFNSYVPLYLESSIPSALPGFIFVVALAGFFMGIDNLIAIVMNPIMGSRSDKTKTRFGRRMPYLIAGIPLAAAFFIGLPLTQGIAGMPGLIGLVVLILGFDISMSIYRAPVVAMMPDFTPPEKRSPANGVINLMGGIGSIFAFVAGSILYGVSPLLAFGVTALIMLLCLAVLVFAIHEPEIPLEVEKVSYPLGRALHEAASDRSILSILFAIFAWFMAYTTLETWFTSYGVFTLGMAPNTASFTMTLFALVFIIFAIPGGAIALKLGRKRTIMIGIIGFIAVLIITPIVASISQLILMGVLGFGGFFWAFINVNSIVMLWEVSRKKQGTFTGIYYVFSQSASAIGPIVFGFLADVMVIYFGFTVTTKWMLLWPFAIIFLIIAFIAMLGVKRGEVGEERALAKE
jgi:maltose/moltooligosaccharide transporter